jgi:hypothetical protein
VVILGENCLETRSRRERVKSASLDSMGMSKKIEKNFQEHLFYFDEPKYNQGYTRKGPWNETVKDAIKFDQNIN